MKTLVIALRACLVTLVLTGIAYPLVTTGLSRALFREASAGSLASDGRRTVGSELIGQAFSKPYYFQARPSAAGDKGWDAADSSGSNLGPTSQKLRARVEADIARLRKENPDATGSVPVELVTTSGSGLDPHLSPEAVLWQLPRVAHARGIAPERVREVVGLHTEGRQLGFLGEPRVNILLLNLALDRVFGQPPS
jgi:K+-transporting ATPase ATPase C chain